MRTPAAQPAAAAATTWTRQQVEQLLREENLTYQRIELPYGLTTGGRDRSATARHLFPDDLSGLSVLDIGCNDGYFCHEAARRGAAMVTGIDIEPDTIRRAKRVADCLGYDIDFRVHDIERTPFDERYDIVLCLNVMHHFRNPLWVLDVLRRITRRRLLLEVVGFGRHDRRKLGIGRATSWLLGRLPVIFAAPTGTRGGHYSPKFVMTPAAIENVLTAHRHEFAMVRRLPGEFKDRTLIACDKRRVNHLVVLAGPCAVGKTYLIERMAAGEANEVMKAMDLKRGAYEVANASKLDRLTDAEVDTLLLHYNILCPYNHKTTYATDEFLGLIECADRVTFATLWTDHDRYMRQFEQVKIAARTSGGKFKGQRRNEQWHRTLRDRAAVVSLYRRWFDFTADRGRNLVMCSTSEGYEVTTIEGWDRRMGMRR